MYAQALLQAGRGDDAHAVLREAAADGFASVPMDMVWSTTLVNCAELAFLFDDHDAAATLYELLQPHAGTIAWSGATISGSVEGYLGLLATTLEDYDDGVAHLEAAARTHERMNAPIFLAANHLGLATALLRRGGTTLVPVFRRRHLRVFEVPHPTGIVTGSSGARVVRLDEAGLTIAVRRPGTYRIATRYSPYWRTSAGCVARTPSGMTQVTVRRGGVVRLTMEVTAYAGTK